MFSKSDLMFCQSDLLAGLVNRTAVTFCTAVAVVSGAAVGAVRVEVHRAVIAARVSV
jgi:hypothetical protein